MKWDWMRLEKLQIIECTFFFNFYMFTLVKSFVLNEISHITTVLPKPSLKRCKVFDDVIHDFKIGNNCGGKTKNS